MFIHSGQSQHVHPQREVAGSDEILRAKTKKNRCTRMMQDPECELMVHDPSTEDVAKRVEFLLVDFVVVPVTY